MTKQALAVQLIPDLPPQPTSGRPAFEWHAHAKGPLWAYYHQGGWTFALYLKWSDEEFISDELRIFPTAGWSGDSPEWDKEADAPGRGLTANALRAFPFGAVFREARRQLMPPHSGTEDQTIEWHDLVQRGGLDPFTIAETPSKPRRGRPPLSEEELALVAYWYEIAIRDSEKSPIRFVADRLHDPNPDRIRDVVVKCRARGYLTAALAPGRPGGEMTEKAVEVLQRMNSELIAKDEEEE